VTVLREGVSRSSCDTTADEERAQLQTCKTYTLFRTGTAEGAAAQVSSVDHEMQTETIRRRNQISHDHSLLYPEAGHLPSEVMNAIPSVNSLRKPAAAWLPKQIGGRREQVKGSRIWSSSC